MTAPDGCVIAQQYSSATFVSCAYIPARKISARFSKSYGFNFYLIFNTVYV
jgi:hypothetical protein